MISFNQYSSQLPLRVPFLSSYYLFKFAAFLIDVVVSNAPNPRVSSSSSLSALQTAISRGPYIHLPSSQPVQKLLFSFEFQIQTPNL